MSTEVAGVCGRRAIALLLAGDGDNVAESPLKIPEIVSSYGFNAPLGGDQLVDDYGDLQKPSSEQTILVGELHHRLQNTLAIVLALSRMTARTVKTVDEFQVAFGQRIEAMARTNALLLRGQVQAISVQAALEAELRPYLGDDGQVTLICDPLEVSPDVALKLSLIFHELATNAVKYGSLSTASGRLSIGCEGSSLGAVLTWSETVSAPIAFDRGQGSGSLLITRLTRSLGGTATIDLRPTGLKAEITFKLQ